MLLLILSLFSYYDLLSCDNNEKAKFDESLLMKRHHLNFLHIKDFINKAQHKFHDEKSVLRVGDDGLESTRDDELLDHGITKWWWDKTASIVQPGPSAPQTSLLPLVRSRPSFPVSITPFTTELNSRHLKWDAIFASESFYNRPSESRLSTDHDISIPPKKSSLPTKTLEAGSETWNEKPFGLEIYPPKLHKYTKPLDQKTTLLPNTSLRGHSGSSGSTTTLITPNDQFMNAWLRETTAYTPVERWFKTLPTQTEMAPSYNYTTTHAYQVGSTISKAESSMQSRQLKNESKDQPPLILRQGISLSEIPTEVDDYVDSTASTVTTKRAQFFIKNVAGILNARNALEMDEERTKMINERPATVANDGEIKLTPATSGDVLHIEQDPETQKQYSNRSRRFHSKVRKKINHRHSLKRHRARQRHQKQRYRYPEYSNGHVFLRLQKDETTEDWESFSIITPKQRFKETRPTENRKHKDPTHPPNEILQFNSEHYGTEDEELIKLIERRDEPVRKTAPKFEPYFYNQVKESLKQAASRRNAKRLKLKDELLRKIVEGSSYSDEEASLTRNLIQALQYGNSSFDPRGLVS